MQPNFWKKQNIKKKRKQLYQKLLRRKGDFGDIYFYYFKDPSEAGLFFKKAFQPELKNEGVMYAQAQSLWFWLCWTNKPNTVSSKVVAGRTFVCFPLSICRPEIIYSLVIRVGFKKFTFWLQNNGRQKNSKLRVNW